MLRKICHKKCTKTRIINGKFVFQTIVFNATYCTLAYCKLLEITLELIFGTGQLTAATTDRQKQLRALHRSENGFTAGSNKARKQSQLRALYNFFNQFRCLS